MKYVFILNPNAGTHHAEDLKKELEQKYQDTVAYELYFTKGKKDATNFIKEYCKQNPEEQACFVACGGSLRCNKRQTCG